MRVTPFFDFGRAFLCRLRAGEANAAATELDVRNLAL
jgi:hypothetical protein